MLRSVRLTQDQVEMRWQSSFDREIRRFARWDHDINDWGTRLKAADLASVDAISHFLTSSGIDCEHAVKMIPLARERGLAGQIALDAEKEMKCNDGMTEDEALSVVIERVRTAKAKIAEDAAADKAKREIFGRLRAKSLAFVRESDLPGSLPKHPLLSDAVNGEVAKVTPPPVQKVWTRPADPPPPERPLSAADMAVSAAIVAVILSVALLVAVAR